MSSLMQRTLAPLTQPAPAVKEPQTTAKTTLATPPESESKQPLAANTDAQPLHFGDPKAPVNNVAMQTILQRFLQDFEYVELDFPVSGSLIHPEEGLSYHPHVQFRMCGDDRKSMNPDQINTYLARQIDRGSYILQKLGFETDDFYLNPDRGTLSFDARVPKDKLPEGVSEKDVLNQLVDTLQQACTEARAKRPQMAIGQ